MTTRSHRAHVTANMQMFQGSSRCHTSVWAIFYEQSRRYKRARAVVCICDHQIDIVIMSVFDTLPVELRLYVFKYVFYGSSTKIHIGPSNSPDYRRRRRGRRFDVVTTTHHHALLVCQRWYGEGLGVYYRLLELYVYDATTASTAPALSGLHKHFRDHVIQATLSWRRRPSRLHRFRQLQSITCTPARKHLHLADWSTLPAGSIHSVSAQSTSRWRGLHNRVEAALDCGGIRLLEQCAPQVILRQDLCFLVRCSLHSIWRYHQHSLEMVRTLSIPSTRGLR